MMKVPAASSETRAIYQALVDALSPRGVASGAMFGMPSLKVGGKAFAGLFGDALVFKLGEPARGSALGLSGAALFDPSGMGRAMKEWVVVPAVHGTRWHELAEQALAHVDPGATSKSTKRAVARPKTAAQAVAKPKREPGSRPKAARGR